MAFVNVIFGERRVKLREASITLRNLALVFRLDEATIYITSEEHEVLIADDNGMFQGLNPANNYILHGDPAVQTVQTNYSNAQPRVQPGLVPARSRLNPPPIPPLARPSFSTPSGSTSANTSSTRKPTWKKAFVHISVEENKPPQERCQLHLPLTEETATVDCIKTLLKDQVGCDIEILDSKFLPIVESPLTKGKLISIFIELSLSQV